jgi:hypothetical protein
MQVVCRQLNWRGRSRLGGKSIGGSTLSQPAYLPKAQTGTNQCYHNEAGRQ